MLTMAIAYAHSALELGSRDSNPWALGLLPTTFPREQQLEGRSPRVLFSLISMCLTECLAHSSQLKPIDFSVR